MPDLKQSLKDFIATSNSGKYSTEEELMSKFPELQGYDIQSLRDFVATSNSGKYSTEEEVFSKFPEFGFTAESPLKKKELAQSPLQKTMSGTMESPSANTSLGLPKPFSKEAVGEVQQEDKLAEIEATAEPTEEDYFQGTFGKVLNGFDNVTHLGLGDYADDLARSVASGYRQGVASEKANDLLVRGSLTSMEDIQKFIDTQKDAQALGQSAEMQEYQKIYEESGKGVWGVVNGLFRTGATIVPELIISSMVSMASNTDALVAGASVVGTGTALGAAGGLPAAGVGAIPGAVGGAVASVPYAFGAASTMIEMGSTFGELLSTELDGKEFNKENVKAVLEDPEKVNSMRNKAIARGLVIGTIDAFTGKLASGVGAKILTTSAAKSTVGLVTKAAATKAIAAGAGVEAAGGMLGETLGRVAAGQEMDVSEIMLEGISELPGGVRSTIQAKYAKPVYKVNGAKQSAETIDHLINTMTPDELQATKFDIKNDYEGRAAKIQDKVVSHAIKQEIRQVNPTMSEEKLDEMTSLEKELRSLESNKTQAGKDKAASIRQNIKEITDTHNTERTSLQDKINEIDKALLDENLTEEEKANLNKEKTDLDLKLNPPTPKKKVTAPKVAGILSNPETTTTALEALPTEEKANTTFTDNEGSVLPVTGNEKKLADLFHEAQTVAEEDRTPSQQSAIDAVEVSLKTPLDLESEVARLQEEFPMSEAEKEIAKLNNDEEYVRTANSLDDVPVEFRDRVKESTTTGETTTRKTFLGIPYGKETKVASPKTYTYTATGQELKNSFDAALKTERQAAVAPTTDTGVSVTNKSSLETIKSGLTDAMKIKVINSAEKAVKTLKSIFPNFDMVVHTDEGSYNAAVQKEKGTLGTSGNFSVRRNAEGKIVGGRIDINLSKATTTTVAHEVAHSVLLHAFGDNPALFKSFRDKISKIVSEDNNKKLMEFTDQYTNKEVQPEEYLVQLTALMEQEKENISTTTYQKIAALINNFVSTITAGQIKVFEDIKNTKDLIDFLNSTSKAIRGGEEITTKGIKEQKGATSTSRSQIVEKPNTVKNIDVKSIRMLSRAGNRVSKGLSVKTVNKEKVVQEAEDLTIDYVKEKAPEIFIKNADLISKYPIVEGIKKFGKITNIKDAQEVYDIFTRQISDNLKYLMDNFKKELKDISTLWYDGANILAQNFSKKYGVSTEQAAGIMASLSPQKDWYQNVRLAEMVMMAFKENPVMTKEMVQKQKEIIETGLEEYTKDLDKAKLAYKKSRTIANAEKLKKEIESYNKYFAKTQKVLESLSELIGKDMNSVPTDMKGYYVRLFNEINTTKDYDILSPDGNVIGIAKKDDGTNAKVAWGSYTEIGKAVSIYVDGSQENITKTLGEMHKIRNFYNNIIDPMSPDKDVTMDTHAIAAALMLPLSGKTTQVKANFGTGTSNSSPLGIKGLYYAFAEGYNLAAKETGLLPRQVQSITWEAIRGLFTDKFKTNKTNIATINQIVESYTRGEININEAREKITTYAGGIKDPSWAGGPLQEESTGDIEGETVGQGSEGNGPNTVRKIKGDGGTVNDKENIAGVQSNLGKGQESKQAKPNKGTGKEKTSTGRNVQASEKEVGTPTSKSQVASEVKELEQSFPISKSEINLIHGTPHIFPKFSTEKIGTGEGAQAFGWGLYFTDLIDIAKNYADKLSSSRITIDGIAAKVPMDPLFFAAANEVARVGYEKAVENNKYDLKYSYNKEEIEQINKYTEELKNKKVEYKKQGLLYDVTVHKGKTPDQYTWLEWDKPLSKKQKEKIFPIISDDIKSKYNIVSDEYNNYFVEGKNGYRYSIAYTEKKSAQNYINNEIEKALENGEKTYNSLTSLLGSPKKASLFLLENGIDGIKYPAESISRGATSDTARGSNYVVFDENAVTINTVSKAQQKAVNAINKIIKDARGQGFSEEAIKTFLESKGLTSQEATEAMAAETSASNKVVLSEEMLPGFDKLMEQVDASVVNNESLSDTIDSVMSSKVYENATDIQKEKLIRDVNKKFGKREKTAPSKETILGTISNVNKITMAESALLSKQIKDYAKGAKNTKAAWIKASAQLTKDIKALVGTGKITVKQAANVLRRFSAVNVFSEKSIGRFVDYMTKVFADAEYANQISIANKTRKAISSLSKNDTKNANLRVLGKQFSELDPSLIEDIYTYNKNASELKESLIGSKVASGSLKLVDTVDIESVSDYINTEKKIQDKILEQEKIAEAREIMGEDISNLTDEEIKDLFQQEEDIKNKKKADIKDSIKNVFEVYSTLIKETISSGFDVFTGEPRTFTEKEKNLVGRFMDMNLDNLDSKQALAAYDSLVNFFQNNSTARMEAVVSEYTGRENARKLVEKGIKSIPLAKYFIPSLGRGLAENTYNLNILFERMFVGVNSGAYVEKMMGVTSLINKKAYAQAKSNAITTEYVAKFYKQKANGESFNTAANNAERGISAFLQRNIFGTDAEVAEEFKRRMDFVEKTINDLSQGTEKEQKKSELYEEAYEKFKDARNIQDVIKATDKVNLEAIQFWQNKWAANYNDLADVSLNVYNKVLEQGLNYTPDKSVQLSEDAQEDKTDLLNNESAFHTNNGTVYKKETGVLQKAIRPDPKNTKRIMDFSFDKNNANSMYDALVDINTASAIRLIDGFLKSDDFKKIFKSDDRRVIDNRIKLYIRNIRKKNAYSDDGLNKLLKGLNKIASIGVGQALGGPTQSIKQVIPIIGNTLINAGTVDIKSSLDIDFLTWLKNSGYSIAVRGDESQVSIDSLTKILKEESKGVGNKVVDFIEKGNERYLKLFLIRPDVFIARASWKSYYENNLKKQGIDVKGLDYSKHQINEDAANYAQKMVDRQQNISDADMAGKIFTNKGSALQILMKIFMPFASFRMNQAARLGSDLNVLTSPLSTKEDKKIAALSLTGFSVEQVMYKMLVVTFAYYLGSFTKWLMDDDEDEEERKKRLDNIIKGQATSTVTDVFSPIPVLDPFIQYGAAYLTEEAQDALDIEDLEKVHLYEPKAKDFLEQFGLFGIPVLRANELRKMALLAYDGTYTDNYGKEKQITEENQAVLKKLITFSLMADVGILPVEVNTITRNAIKFAKANSTSTSDGGEGSGEESGGLTKSQLKRYYPARYERLYGKSSPGYYQEELLKDRAKRLADKKRELLDARYGYKGKD